MTHYHLSLLISFQAALWYLVPPVSPDGRP
jgi:hypothetical protein